VTILLLFVVMVMMLSTGEGMKTAAHGDGGAYPSRLLPALCRLLEIQHANAGFQKPLQYRSPPTAYHMTASPPSTSITTT